MTASWWRANRRATRAGSTRKQTRRVRPVRLTMEHLEDRCLLSSASALTHLPLFFERNDGQAGPGIDYLARGTDYTLGVGPGQATLSLSPANDASPPQVLGVQVIGANTGAAAQAADPLNGKINYIVGNDPSRWLSNVPTFGQVRYQGVYNGVDLVYHGGGQQALEYDFVVHPGADAGVIRLAITGAQSISIDGHGNLVLHTPQGDVIQQAPVLYQDINGVRQSVAGHFVLQDQNTVGFAVGAYDRTQPLTIDPVLNYSTYLGGTGNEQGLAVATDGTYIYVTGSATEGLTQKNQSQRAYGGGPSDAFVAKINPNLIGATSGPDSLVWLTYIGGGGPGSQGPGADIGRAVAVDASGNVHIAGSTTSTDFPIWQYGSLIPIQLFNGGSSDFHDGFVAELNSLGQISNSQDPFLYSTYLGGGADDDARAIAVDPDGTTYVTGTTFSTDFPGADNSLHGQHDAFLVKIRPNSTLVYSEFLGGSANDFANAIARDTAGNVYIGGQTSSTDFPTQSPYQGALFGTSDAFVMRLDAAAGDIQAATYLGGTGAETATGVAVDSSGNLYVTGNTFSSDFPTAGNPFQPTNGGGQDAFVIKFNPLGFGPVYSSYLGGSGTDSATGIALPGNGDGPWLSGLTASSNFPTANAIQQTLSGVQDGFVAQLNVSGSSLASSTYFGSPGTDSVNAIASDSLGNAYIAGTASQGGTPLFTYLVQNGPTRVPYQSTFGGGTDAFVEKFVPGNVLTMSPISITEGHTGITVNLGADRNLFSDHQFFAFFVPTDQKGRPTTGANQVGGVYYPDSSIAGAIIPARLFADEGGGYIYFVDLTSGQTNELWFQITDAPLTDVTPAAPPTSVVEGKDTGDQIVAVFQDANPNGPPTDFSLTSIDWGDGSTSRPTLIKQIERTADHVTYEIHGRNVYADEQATPYTVTATIRDAGGQTLTVNSRRILVTDAPLTETPVTLNDATEGRDTGPITVASFTDGNSNATGSEYTLSVNWGDGTTSRPTLNPQTQGKFTLSDRHTYRDEGTYNVTALIQDAGGQQLTTHTSVHVLDAPLTNRTAITTTSSVAGVDTPPLVLGNFADANTSAPASDFTNSVIQWGDGTTSRPTIDAVSGTPGLFNVRAEHAYATPGSYAVHILVQDAGGSSVGIDLTATAYAPQSLPVTAIEGTPTGNAVVATFKDPDAAVHVTDFKATIDWGDGHTSQGVIATDSQGFKVLGSNTYAEEGSATVLVTLQGTAGGGSNTVQGVATIFDAPLSSSGSSFNASSGAAFTGTVAGFSDSNTSAPAADFAATIAWGDGLTSAGVVNSVGGGNFTVTGTHTYGGVASYQTTITINDRGGSSTTATGTAKVGFGPPPDPGPVPAPGAGNIAAAASGPNSTVFVIAPASSLYRHDQNGWVKLGDNIFQISASTEASGNPVVFAVTNDHALYRFDNLEGWQIVGAPHTVQQVSAGTDANGRAAAFVLTAATDFTEYRRSTGWLPSPVGARGTILSVSAADKDRAAVITTDHSVFEFDLAHGWSQLTGKNFAQSISAVGDTAGRFAVFAITADNALWSHLDGGSWNKIGGSGSILAISAGTDQSGAADVYAITFNRDLAEFRMRTGQWALLYPGNPHPATELAATAVDRLFMTLGDGSVYGKDEVSGITQLAGAGFAQP